MRKLDVKTTKPYCVYIESGLRYRMGKMVNDYQAMGKPVVITDANVYSYYEKCIQDTLKEMGADGRLIVLPAGEEQKSMQQLSNIYERLAEMGVTRDDTLMAIGGGVIGDLTGFAAATFLRGIGFIQVPTTLLADVDSSVGGKTAINLKAGKNLAGAFYQPNMVLIDPEFLQTLPKEQVACGMAEVIKTACIRDKSFFDELKQAMSMEEIIERCCQIKIDVVEGDEFDKGLRMLLNFGHTAGHGIEKLAGYGAMTHGHAVAIGMQMVTDASERAGITKEGTARELKMVLEKYHLKSEMPNTITIDDIVDEMKTDKKNLYGKLNLIVLNEIGHSEVVAMTMDEVYAFYRNGIAG
jgi:3-dehydroquinate synthase